MKLIVNIFMGTSLIFLSCESTDSDCKCVEMHLQERSLSDECKSYLEGKSEESIREEATECFGEDIEDLSNIIAL